MGPLKINACALKLVCLLVTLFSGAVVADDTFVFTDRNAFFEAVGKHKASSTYTAGNRPVEPAQRGEVAFDAISPSTLNFGAWPVNFPDDNNIELGINGNESLDIISTVGPVYAMGIDFDQDSSEGLASSKFNVTLREDGVFRGRYLFETPDNNIQFIGVWSPRPFDRMQIREVATANENEYFGSVWTSQRQPSSKVRKLKDATGAARELFGAAVALEGSRALIGQPGDRGIFFEFIRFRDRNTGAYRWGQVATVSAGADLDKRGFGSAIALQGDRALISAPFFDTFRGQVFEYERTVQGWEQRGVLGDFLTDRAFPYFGESVALDGTLAIVGAPSVPQNSGGSGRGRVYVLERSGDGTWAPTGELLHPASGLNERFGLCVGLSGALAVACSKTEAFVYLRTADGDWERIAEFAVPNPSPASVRTPIVVKGNRVLVTVSDNGDRVVLVLDLEPNGTLLETARLENPSDEANDGFGNALALTEDAILVGATLNRQLEILGTQKRGIGVLYRFTKKSDGAWSAKALVAPDGNQSERFGEAIAADGLNVLVGVDSDDDQFRESGAAYLFELGVLVSGFEENGGP